MIEQDAEVSKSGGTQYRRLDFLAALIPQEMIVLGALMMGFNVEISLTCQHPSMSMENIVEDIPRITNNVLEQVKIVGTIQNYVVPMLVVLTPNKKSIKIGQDGHVPVILVS